MKWKGLNIASLWGMFISWHIITKSMVSIAADMANGQLGSVEWFYITILVTCVTVLFGLSTWLLGKTLSRINQDIEQRRAEIESVRRDTASQISELTQNIASLTACVSRLKGEHDAFIGRGIHTPGS